MRKYASRNGRIQWKETEGGIADCSPRIFLSFLLPIVAREPSPSLPQQPLWWLKVTSGSQDSHGFSESRSLLQKRTELIFCILQCSKAFILLYCRHSFIVVISILAQHANKRWTQFCPQSSYLKYIQCSTIVFIGILPRDST